MKKKKIETTSIEFARRKSLKYECAFNRTVSANISIIAEILTIMTILSPYRVVRSNGCICSIPKIITFDLTAAEPIDLI